MYIQKKKSQKFVTFRWLLGSLKISNGICSGLRIIPWVCGWGGTILELVLYLDLLHLILLLYEIYK